MESAIQRAHSRAAVLSQLDSIHKSKVRSLSSHVGSAERAMKTAEPQVSHTDRVDLAVDAIALGTLSDKLKNAFVTAFHGKSIVLDNLKVQSEASKSINKTRKYCLLLILYNT